MPEFGNPFSGLKHDRKLTDEEVEDIIKETGQFRGRGADTLQ